MRVFEERGKPEYPRKNRTTRGKTSQSREENQETQPTHDAESGNRTRATLVGGECSHHNATTALLYSWTGQLSELVKCTNSFPFDTQMEQIPIVDFTIRYPPCTAIILTPIHHVLNITESFQCMRGPQSKLNGKV